MGSFFSQKYFEKEKIEENFSKQFGVNHLECFWERIDCEREGARVAGELSRERHIGVLKGSLKATDSINM